MTNSTNPGGNVDISQFQRGKKNKPIFLKLHKLRYGSPAFDMGSSINSPLGGQVGFPDPAKSLFTLVSKLVSATNGRSWNTGTEVSFGEPAV